MKGKMRTKILLYFLLTVCNLSFAQHNTFNKEAELQKFVERGGKVEKISPNIYKLTYSDGAQQVLNFNPAPTQNLYTEDFDTTIINIWEIDTTLYAHKFRFWQKVNLAGGRDGTIPIEDINQNGLLEFYGRTRYTWPYGGQVDILEQNNQGIFQTAYSYDSTSIGVLGVGDINSDSINEVHLRTVDTLNGKFYKADSIGALPTSFDFIFYYHPNIIGNETFGDFDRNGITDCAFIDGNNPSRILISEFRDSINNFTTMFNMPTEGDDPAGFAVGDFDQDNKTELVIGTGLQQVYVVEAEDTNQYSVVWNGSAPSVAAYMLTSTNDIDNNGKPEFWIGGMDFTTGITTFWCYEANRDNNYIPVAGIELRYLVSLFTFYLQAVDIDNDGKEELVIDMGDYLLILQFTGKPNQHSYDLFYAKIGETTQPSAIFYPSTIYDLNKDGRKDILLSMDIWPPPDLSYVLIQDTVTPVTENGSPMPSKFDLSQNYPNPCNPRTQIDYSIKSAELVSLQVYDLLGRQVAELVNEQQEPGNYSVEFSARGGSTFAGKLYNLPSGIYVYVLSTGNFMDTKKLILLK